MVRILQVIIMPTVLCSTQQFTYQTWTNTNCGTGLAATEAEGDLTFMAETYTTLFGEGVNVNCEGDCCTTTMGETTTYAKIQSRDGGCGNVAYADASCTGVASPWEAHPDGCAPSPGASDSSYRMLCAPSPPQFTYQTWTDTNCGTAATEAVGDLTFMAETYTTLFGEGVNINCEGDCCTTTMGETTTYARIQSQDGGCGNVPYADASCTGVASPWEAHPDGCAPSPGASDSSYRMLCAPSPPPAEGNSGATEGNSGATEGDVESGASHAGFGVSLALVGPVFAASMMV